MEYRLETIAVSLFIVVIILALLRAADARDMGQWEHQPANIREWFQKLTQPDAPHLSCCGEADAYEADSFEVSGDRYVAVITNGTGDERVGKPAIPNGTRFVVPNNKLKWDAGNPTGRGIIFIGRYERIYCYVVPGGA